MVLDTSAIIALIFREAERDVFVDLISAEIRLAISAATLHEASVVTARKKRDVATVVLVDQLVSSFSIEVVPLDVSGAREARDAYLHFGKGFHPASLNLADCFPYALAKARDEPLLFKGSDFLKTDIVPAWRP
jgi:ribonuclease VapC